LGRKNRRRYGSEQAPATYTDQIIRKLAEGNKLFGTGQELAEVCRHLEVTESTWHRWVAQYGGMKADDAKRLKELEAENARLKKLVANQVPDIDMLKEISSDAPIDVKCWVWRSRHVRVRNTSRAR
jgi:transposase-like protein